MTISKALWKTRWRFLKKLKTDIASGNSTTGFISKGNEISASRRCVHPNVHCNTIYNDDDMESTKISTKGRTDNQNIFDIPTE
jgi:hypothetical protein